MKRSNLKIKLIVFFSAMSLLILPVTSLAQDHGHDEHHDNHGHNDRDGRHDHHDMDHDRKEKVVVRHDDYREVIVKERHFFYRGGAFYERRPEGYVVVTAPVGARVEVLPAGFKVVRYHRMKYFAFGGIYYRFMPRERVYVVVSAPF